MIGCLTNWFAPIFFLACLGTKKVYTKPHIDTLEKYIDTLFPPTYRNDIRPFDPYAENPITNVSISLYGNELLSVDVVQQNFEIDLTLILEWNDTRLNLDRIDRQVSISDENLIRKFWIPDIYVINGQQLSVVQSIQPIRKLTITEAGTLYYVRRFDAQMQCSLNLEKYPHDYNYCNLRFSSLQYNSSEIFIWIKYFDFYQDEYPHYRVRMWYTWPSCQPYNKPIQENPCIVATIKFVRHLSYYVIRYYLLDYLAVQVSFVGFWIPVNMWPARVALVIVPLLNLITQDISINNDIEVNYVTSFHWWMMWIQGYVYMDMAEYAMAMAWAHFISDKKNHRKLLEQARNDPTMNVPPVLEGYYFGNNGWWRKCGDFWDRFLYFFFGEVDFQMDPYVRNKVDYIARVLAPLSFTMFVLIYCLATAAPWAGNYN